MNRLKPFAWVNVTGDTAGITKFDLYREVESTTGVRAQ